MASLCFREAPLFPGITANARFASLRLHSVRSEAFPLHPVPVNISSQSKGSAVQREGRCSGHQETRNPALALPSWRGTLDECLCSWAFLSSPVKQRGQNWMGVFPMIPSGFKIASCLLSIGSLKVSLPCIQNHIFPPLLTGSVLSIASVPIRLVLNV